MKKTSTKNFRKITEVEEIFICAVHRLSETLTKTFDPDSLRNQLKDICRLSDKELPKITEFEEIFICAVHGDSLNHISSSGQKLLNLLHEGIDSKTQKVRV